MIAALASLGLLLGAPPERGISDIQDADRAALERRMDRRFAEFARTVPLLPAAEPRARPTRFARARLGLPVSAQGKRDLTEIFALLERR